MTLRPMPSLEAWARIPDPAERLLHGVTELFAGVEFSLGQMWVAYRLQDESPVMAQMVQGVEQFLQAAAAILCTGVDAARGPEAAGYVSGPIHPLTYRILRLSGGLSQEQAVRHTVLAAAAVLGLELPS